MGNKPTTIPQEGLGHPELYLEGVAAAEEGAYGLSEILFHQPLRSHPAARFWDSVIRGVYSTGKKRKDGKSVVDSAGYLNNASSTANSSLPPKPPSEKSPDTAEGVCAFGDSFTVGGGGTDAPDASTTVPEADVIRNMTDPPTEPTSAAVLIESTEEIELPLDKRLWEVVDYVRLCADCANAYLRSPSTEKSCRLAMIYCVYGAGCAQSMLHLLRLYKEMQELPQGDFLNDAASENRNYANKQSAAVKHRMNVLATKKEVRFALALFEQKMRWFFLSFLLSYLKVSHENLWRLGEPEPKVQQAFKEEALSGFRAAHDLLMELVDMHPDEPVSKVTRRGFGNVRDVLGEHYEEEEAARSFPRSSKSGRAQMRTGNAGRGSEFAMATQASSNGSATLKSRQTNASIYGVNIFMEPSVQSQQSFLYVSRYMSEVIPIVSHFTNVLPVKLVTPSSVYYHHLNHIRSPGQRFCFYFVSWSFDVGYERASGVDDVLLAKALPGYGDVVSKQKRQSLVLSTITGQNPAYRRSSVRDRSSMGAAIQLAGAPRELAAESADQVDEQGPVGRQSAERGLHKAPAPRRSSTEVINILQQHRGTFGEVGKASRHNSRALPRRSTNRTGSAVVADETHVSKKECVEMLKAVRKLHVNPLLDFSDDFTLYALNVDECISLCSLVFSCVGKILASCGERPRAIAAVKVAVRGNTEARGAEAVETVMAKLDLADVRG